MVILDNGHGKDTKGKQAPDGSLYEYELNRDIVCRLIYMLDESGIDFWELVPEQDDISLSERCRRANKVYEKYPDAFLISIHANAGGGTGWEVWTSPGETLSDQIADVFFREASKDFPEFRMRKNSHMSLDKEAEFKILMGTKCPAILTENFFMDHPRDLAFLKSDEGRNRIALMHHDAIVNWTSRQA